MGTISGESPEERPTISIPDRIAYARMILVLPIVTLVLVADRVDHAMGIAAALMACAAFTDFLDGYLARRWQITSILGGFLDTIADKLLVAGTLFALVGVGRAWAWAGFIIVGREIAISGLRGVAAMDGVVVPPSIWGKWKATTQFLAIFLAMLRTPDKIGGLYPDQWAMLVAIAFTVLSGVEYFSRFARVLRADRARA